MGKQHTDYIVHSERFAIIIKLFIIGFFPRATKSVTESISAEIKIGLKIDKKC